MPGQNILGQCVEFVDAGIQFTSVDFSVTISGTSSFTADHGSGSASFSDSHSDHYDRVPFVNGSSVDPNTVQIYQQNCCCRAQWNILSGSPSLSDCSVSAEYDSECSGFITESKVASISGFAEDLSDGSWGIDPPDQPKPCKKSATGDTLPPTTGQPFISIQFSGLTTTGPTASAPAMTFTGTSVMSAPGASDVDLGYPVTAGSINVPIDPFSSGTDIVVTIQMDATGSGTDIGWGHATGSLSWTITIELNLS